MRKPITSEQEEQFCQMAKHLWAEAIGITVGQLKTDGEISLEGLQRVLGGGKKLKPKMIGFLKEAIFEMAAETTYLKLISGDKKVMIGATDGKDILANANDVFSWIDPEFTNWGLTETSDPTEDSAMQVNELVAAGTFKQIYRGFDTDLENLCQTQSQIKKFCVEQRDWLWKDGYGTFFLFKKDQEKPATPENLFVAVVRVGGGGRLSVRVLQFSDGIVWGAGYAVRFVIPQQALEK